MAQETIKEMVDRLAITGVKYRKELLAMPLVQFKAKLEPYVTIRYNVRGKETVGTLDADAEVRPYKTEKNASGDYDITLRELETFMGDVVKEFDPRVISNSVYGNLVATNPTEADITKAIAMEMVKRVSNKLYKACFTGVRKADGSTTADLFDGFCTIIDKEVTSGNLSASKGNLIEIGNVHPSNAYDKVKALYDSLSEELQDENAIMIMSKSMKAAYENDYATMFPGAAYNTKFEQTVVQGSEGRCTIVGLSAMAGTDKIIVTTRENLLVGVDQMSDYETVRIRECDNPKVAQLFMILYWGVQFESVDARRLCVARYKYSATEPETI